MSHLILQYNVARFVEEVIVEFHFCTEDQKIFEMKITEK